MEEKLLREILVELKDINDRIGYIETHAENSAQALAGIKAEVDEIRIAYEAKNFPGKKAV